MKDLTYSQIFQVVGNLRLTLTHHPPPQFFCPTLKALIIALTLALTLIARSQPLTLPQIFQLYQKPYIIAPSRPEGTTYITKTGKTITTTATATTLPSNQTISTAETNTIAPVEEIVAIIETHTPPEEIRLDLNLTHHPPPQDFLAPPFETLLKILSQHAIITLTDTHYLIEQKATLRTPEGEYREGTYEQLYALALELAKTKPKTQTALLYPTISSADFLVLCQSIKAQCYPFSSAVLVKTTQEKLQELRQYAREKKPRYRVEAIIAQLTDTAKKELSLELNINLSQAPIPKFAEGNTNFTDYIIQLQAGTLNALILKLKDQEMLNNALILSHPSVLIDDRQTANIKAGYQIPVITPATQNTPATTTFKDAVLSLEVQPQTLPNGEINLNITLTKDSPDFANRTETGNIPIITNTIKTNITTQKEQLIILGGITEETQIRDRTSPSIPILRHIFGSSRTGKEKKELYIFLTVKEEK